MLNKIKGALRIIKNEGLIRFFIRVLEKLSSGAQKIPAAKKQTIQMLVRSEDVCGVDWNSRPEHLTNVKRILKENYHIAWVMSPPGESSGGHQNIFRFMNYLEKSGHTATVYIYSNGFIPVDIAALKKMLKNNKSYPKLKAEIKLYTEKGIDAQTDAIFATGWETAYPVYKDKSAARRFYFVQDFEPFFYPVGSESVLAENTYKFGFFGITAGQWLSKKLSKDYGMKTDYYDFGADKNTYFVKNKSERREIFFYARPVTARRGFELGILALEEFARQKPDYTINLAGWDVSNYRIPFKYNNLSNLQISELNDIYNRCSTGIVISLTNMSLLPLELLASGVIPVLNDSDNNRLVSNNKNIEYCAQSPTALAKGLIKAVEKNNTSQVAIKISDSVKAANWDESGRRFVKIFEGEMNG